MTKQQIIINMLESFNKRVKKLELIVEKIESNQNPTIAKHLAFVDKTINPIATRVSSTKPKPIDSKNIILLPWL